MENKSPVMVSMPGRRPKGKNNNQQIEDMCNRTGSILIISKPQKINKGITQITHAKKRKASPYSVLSPSFVSEESPLIKKIGRKK